MSSRRTERKSKVRAVKLAQRKRQEAIFKAEVALGLWPTPLEAQKLMNQFYRDIMFAISSADGTV